jgi:hypothetical protein
MYEPRVFSCLFDAIFRFNHPGNRVSEFRKEPSYLTIAVTVCALAGSNVTAHGSGGGFGGGGGFRGGFNGGGFHGGFNGGGFRGGRFHNRDFDNRFFFFGDFGDPLAQILL